MSLVDHPPTMLIAAGRTIYLVLSTQSAGHHDNHDGKPSAQYELGGSLPSQAKEQETECHDFRLFPSSPMAKL